MARTTRFYAASAVLGAAVTGILGARVGEDDPASRLRRAIEPGPARNVILFIGDGMGDSEITIARNYHVGAAGRLAMDTLPFTGAYTTYAVQESEPARPDYVTDSAASGTAWATGFKTSNGRVATAAGSSGVAPLTTILELAQRAGLRTGNVSTAELTDATPAVLDAHVNDRRCHGPADMAACPAYRKDHGGPGSIAEQTVDHKVDVLLGGGRKRFAQTITGGPFSGKTVLQAAWHSGYQVLDDRQALAAVKPPARTPVRVLGLFSEGNMSLEWAGARAAPSPGSGPQVCVQGQRERLTKEPSLAEMTEAALALLSAGREDTGPGFFLQIESASIDKQDHAASPCQQIGETIALDEAIKVGLAFARREPRTLVIVAADHAHTSQIVPTARPTELAPRVGFLSTLVTRDGVPMTVNYSTRAGLDLQDHTGTQVRIAAQGPGAANVVGVTDQTDLFKTMKDALGLRE